MKTLLCGLACLVPSVAFAERITITGASATYWTATGNVEFHVWLDTPIRVPGTFIHVGGGSLRDTPLGRNDRHVSFAIENSQQTRDDVFSVWKRIYNSPTEPRDTLMATMQMPINDRHFSFVVPFDELGIESPLFSWGVIVYPTRNPVDIAGNSFDAYSSIDRRIVYTPEPSSVALASIGVVAVLVHLARRPRKRIGFTERHVGREPTSVGVGSV